MFELNLILIIYMITGFNLHKYRLLICRITLTKAMLSLKIIGGGAQF